MSVPLDRLYHYLADCVNHDLVIYRWTPHGSRKLGDLGMLRGPYRDTQPMMICHDQEPVDLARYTKQDFEIAIQNYFQNHDFFKHQTKLTSHGVISYLADLGFRGLTIPTNQFDRTILLHSEQNSATVFELEQQGYIPVYYWSHGIIAQDWFRYAQHDPVLKFNFKKIQRDFLIYNRAWSGTREYRLCFVEQLLTSGLDQHCSISFNPEDGKHYSTHQFANPNFEITNYDLHNELPPNTHDSTASADYCGADYASTGIEVVLETLFDDSRWHLTEKSLRPIACGQPFMLMATAGSLEYLRQYGFETFGELIDETYDQIIGPRQRLQAVIAEMRKIAALDPESKTQLFAAMNAIARRNQQRFFKGLHEQVINEYKNNMDQAMHTMQQHYTGRHRARIEELMNNQ